MILSCIWLWESYSEELGGFEYPFHCHHSQFHSSPEWHNLLEPCLWLKEISLKTICNQLDYVRKPLKKKLHEMCIWTSNECNSVTSKQKINLNGCNADKINSSINFGWCLCFYVKIRYVKFDLCTLEIWPYYQMVYALTRIRPGEWNQQNSLGFWDIKRSLNPGQKN